ncbi:MAG: hypothetical protein K1X94_14690 [Sandaracinaceae bacterium]|nr:hypothetical protein [Sandaracinaceae bacterium]
MIDERGVMELDAASARAFRLLPSERVLWVGRPVLGVPRPLGYTVVLLASGAVATSSLLFAALLRVSDLPGVQVCVAVALYAMVFAIGAFLVPRYTLDPCEFALTQRRVLLRRGASVRSIDRNAISFARIRWHRTSRGIGTLELIRAVPFGPLMRQERLVLHDLRGPDVVLGLLRGVSRAPHDEDDPQLVEMLDPDEKVLWGAGPGGPLLGWREVATAVLGAVVVGLALRYGVVTFGALRSLEEVGLPVGSEIWSLFFGACLVSFAFVLAVGAGLVWWGLVRSRAEGRNTEYLVTDRRVLIRRGLTELSLDRSRVFDVAEVKTLGGRKHVFFILDGPEGRALGDSGALTGLLPARDLVPPVLYDVEDVGALRTLFGREERDSLA